MIWAQLHINYKILSSPPNQKDFCELIQILDVDTKMRQVEAFKYKRDGKFIVHQNNDLYFSVNWTNKDVDSMCQILGKPQKSTRQ